MAPLVCDNDDGSVGAAQCTPGEGSNAVDMDQQQDGDVYVEDTDQGTEDDEEEEDQERSPRTARGGGLSDYSGASSLAAACTLVKTEVQAAAAPAAQLEGAQEETQIQALLVSFNSTGVPQELMNELQAHVETAREKIMVQLDDLFSVLAAEKPQLEDSAGMLSTERESQARSANMQADTQKRQASTLQNFMKQITSIASIGRFLEQQSAAFACSA